MIKRYPIVLLICSILLLSACQEETIKQPLEQDIPTEVEEKQEVVQETTPIEKIKENALYSWEVQDAARTARLYLVSDDGTTTENGKQYNGNLAFYLVEGTHGILQEHLASGLEAASIDLDKSPFKIYTFGDQTMMTWIASDEAAGNTVTMWIYTGEEMQQVTFEGEPQLLITSDQVKFIEDHYLQAYLYNDGSDESKGIGWFYTTWQWDATTHDFTTYDMRQYVQDDMYGWESGEYFTQLWDEHEAEYISFPHITLTDEFAEVVKKGMLLNNSIHLGDSIDRVLEEFPDYLHHDYYEGGNYYAYPGGSSYFYDEATREITYITLDGTLIINDLSSLITILGEPVESGKDEMADTNYMIFHIGDSRLKVDGNESGQVHEFWLTTH
ncbi:hypothetical protein [Sporosarcina sp. FSL K6-2383]|uniref:hypothetical protein n=1 Tax=Sporosarcina sp. FSL K6-2383 TaxID=2921556 RepID=UPI00315B3789